MGILGNITGSIANAMLGVFSVGVGLYLNIIGTTSGAILGVAITFFNWVSSPSFISLSYTNPDGNAFIKIGWELTRDLTNIVFIIAMVAIGLGTALRLGGYQAQKALPTLIAIALLINFTPVITGVVVDASNIAMGFFINPTQANAGQIIFSKSFSAWSNIGSLAGGLKFWDPRASSGAMAAAVGSLGLIAFNVMASVIYILYGFLFIVRYIAIWLLVILSPLAFAAYILPSTRSFFSQWWKTFIQWSLLGVIASFFIYLSEQFTRIIRTTEFITTAAKDAPNTPGVANIMNNILPYSLPIIILFIGFVISISYSPSAAQGILNAGKRGITTGGKTFGKIYAKRTSSAVKGAARALPRIPSIRAGVEAYKTHRGLRFKTRPPETRREALGHAFERAGAAAKLETGWRAKEAVKAAPGQVVKAEQGFRSALKDSLNSGWTAATGAKKGKRGQPCPQCKRVLPIDTDYCPSCGLRQP